MAYKTNFEPYVSRSPDRGVSPCDETPLELLRSIYPCLNTLHQPGDPFVGYNPHYWAEAYTTHPLEENPRRSLRRVSDCRLVSKLRRLLTREQTRRRLVSSASVSS